MAMAARLVFCWAWLSAADGTGSGDHCPVTGSRPSPVNFVPHAAQPWSGSIRLQYPAWNLSSLTAELSEETEGVLNLAFAGPEGGGMVQVGERFSDMDEYVLRKLRFAFPSEHAVLARRFPLEVQLWHEPAIHRDLYRLSLERQEARQMLERFHGQIQSWRSELKVLEAPPERNTSFPNLRTERDWAASALGDTIQDGHELLRNAQLLQQQIVRIDEKVASLNERLSRPDSARMVVLSMFFQSPHEPANSPAPGQFMRWLAAAAVATAGQRAEAEEMAATSPPPDTPDAPEDTQAAEDPTPQPETPQQLQQQLQQLQQRLQEAEQGGSGGWKTVGQRRLGGGGSSSDDPEAFFFGSLGGLDKDEAASVLSPAAFAYEGSLTRPPCTPVVRWFLSSEPLAVAAEDLIALAGSLPGNLLLGCTGAGHAGALCSGLRPSDGVWWSGAVTDTPEAPQKLPDASMRAASLSFGAFQKPKETHLSTEMVSQLPWPYIQACCGVLLICSIAMLGTTCSMWSHHCCDQ